MHTSLSPLDGRYAEHVDPLRPFFSEAALMHARVLVEILWFQTLAEQKEIRECPALKSKEKAKLDDIIESFNDKDLEAMKKYEQKTRHDVKAVEYFLRDKIGRICKKKSLEFIHFGLTSEDVNNLAYGVLIHGALSDVIRPEVKSLMGDMRRLANRWKNINMLSLTHGQPATPTTVGHELHVFADRLGKQYDQLTTFQMQGKFGGAVGNYSALKAAYPKVKWEKIGKKFLKDLGLDALTHTTQINPHDDIAELSHMMSRINTILLDCSRDMWMYISRGAFKQKVVAGEVGSSTMPHKVNPIDFENAEGNLGISTALFTHFAQKLPVSRMQRDLSDSTVQRNLGVAFGHHLLAVISFKRGLGKIEVDKKAIEDELESRPEIYAEAIQTVLRRHGIENAYDKLKKLTRGEEITWERLAVFIEELPISDEEKERLHNM